METEVRGLQETIERFGEEYVQKWKSLIWPPDLCTSKKIEEQEKQRKLIVDRVSAKVKEEESIPKLILSSGDIQKLNDYDNKIIGKLFIEIPENPLFTTRQIQQSLVGIKHNLQRFIDIRNKKRLQVKLEQEMESLRFALKSINTSTTNFEKIRKKIEIELTDHSESTWPKYPEYFWYLAWRCGVDWPILLKYDSKIDHARWALMKSEGPCSFCDSRRFHPDMACIFAIDQALGGSPGKAPVNVTAAIERYFPYVKILRSPDRVFRFNRFCPANNNPLSNLRLKHQRKVA